MAAMHSGAAFSTMAREDHQAAIVVGTPLSLMYRRDVIVSAAQYRVPTIYETPTRCSNSCSQRFLTTLSPWQRRFQRLGLATDRPALVPSGRHPFKDAGDVCALGARPRPRRPTGVV